uniref:Uncharacterized protein n=1 Tax=Arundo donax TaxID=35708 RepID=A0A0A9FAH0_ARUDO
MPWAEPLLPANPLVCLALYCYLPKINLKYFYTSSTKRSGHFP